ncbi:hypothetical protein F2P56_019127 [Juglans regia]|uniref:RNase H type-1 domain-containing protein n=1 Tax=Juglans regia TaxID=51240 RepID=A0A834CS49_JUGRE|nr:hypothetical protein F2P56_019127 [Juglans regia]
MDLVKRGMVWRVRNWKSIKVWKDKWLQSHSTFQVQTVPNSISPEATVSILIDEERHAWKKEMIDEVFKQDEARLICNIPISSSNAVDKLIWGFSNKGVFSVNSIYFSELDTKKLILGESSSSSQDQIQWHRIWKLCVSGKVESVLHVLWECPAAGDVWGDGASPVKKWSGSFADFPSLWSEFLTRLDSDSLKLISDICYRLWTRRNQFVFDNQFASPSMVLKSAAANVELFKEARPAPSIGEENGISNLAEMPLFDSRRKWRAPIPSWLKVNLDACFDKIQQNMSIGIVIRDSSGDVQVMLAAPRSFVPSAYIAECYALLRAVSLCQELGFELVEYESDAKNVVDAINSNSSDMSWPGQIIEDIRLIMASHQTWKLSFIRREGNQAAYVMAKFGLSLESELV